ncbi:MAG: TonB-dependent receptor family protein [Chitinophagaceae bacterium]|jgi:iron complex outermembrane recepter protein|nr:TonB-dependent receptor family protein [Chitinophagaceae bacterium]
MNLLTSIFINLLLVFSANAQTISGSISNEKKEPVSNATISLLKAKDSSLWRSTVSNNEGSFNLDFTDSISLLLRVSATGYETVTIPVISNNTFTLTLKPAVKQLGEVVVNGQRPMIEVRPDKIVFNIENSINAIGNTAFDLLRKSPGVVIDNNDNVSLLGTGVAVYIDNKPSPLTGTELAAFLKSIQSTDIESIELIKNPSAKYDAAGTGGIINIKLKKNKNYGLNGNINAGYGIGTFAKYNTGITLNYRNKKVNIFGNYSNYWGNSKSFINLYREQADSIFNQKSNNYSNYRGQNAKAGIDFFINKKNTIGFLATVFADNWNDQNLTITPILSLSTKTAARTLTADNRSTGNKLNSNFNFNYKYSDTTGRDWNTDLDFGFFNSLQDNLQPNRYTSPDLQTVLEERIYNIVTDRSIQLFTFKSDYEQNLKKGRISFGIKTSLVNTANAFDFADVINAQTIRDNNRSNDFALTENINAAYINYKQKIKKWDLQLGLRAEQTNTRGRLSSTNSISDRDVKRNYLNFFPSFGLSYQVNQKNSMNLNYSSRINRPGYQSLNPFESKLDELTYQKGNPFLKPEYTNSISVTHSFKYTLNTTVSYSRTTDFSTQITDTTEGSRNFIQQRNAGTQNNLSVNISYPFSIAKWWSVYANIGISRLTNNVNLGVNKVSNLSITSWSLYNQHTITLPKSFSVEVSGFYNSPSIWGGTFRNRPFWGIDAGLQKRLLKEKAVLKISVSDVFFSMQWRGISNFSGLYMDASGGWESRQLKLNFSYRFGRKEIKAQRNRSTGSEDIKNRL